MTELESTSEVKLPFQSDEYLQDAQTLPRPQAGRPVTHTNRREGPVPGAILSSERSAQLQQALREIHVAEMAVRGFDVIV